MGLGDVSNDSFCAQPLWNSTLTWNTTNPDFTPCFEKTVLIWVPCIFLWLLAPLEAHLLIKSKDRRIPWSFWNISKIVISIFLILDECTLLFYHIVNPKEEIVRGVDYMAPSLLVITFLLQLLFVVGHKKCGIQTSAYLFLFWFIMFICSIPAYKTHFLYVQAHNEDANSFGFVTYMIYFPLVVLMFLLNCFADKIPQFVFHSRGEKASPEANSSFLSRLTFSWMDRLMWTGYRSSLTQDRLWNLGYENSSEKVVKDWHKNWAKSLNNAYGEGESHTHATFTKDENQVKLIGMSGNNKYYVSILPTMLRTFGMEFLSGSLMKLIHDCLQFCSPLVLSLLISYADSDKDTTPVWHGYLYAVLLYAISQSQSLILGQYFVRNSLVGLKVRAAIVSAVYRKSLKISSSARKTSTVGEIVNLQSVDAQRFMDLTTYLNMLWSAPLQIGLALYFLWKLLGPSALAGLAVMILIIPVNWMIANKVKKLQMSQMKKKDERVRLMSEILNAMKLLKLYAWEPSFQDQVLDIRTKEIKVLKKAAYFNAGTSFIWTCTPFLVSLATFAVYVTIEDKSLDSKTAFVSLSLFNLLRFPMSMLPTMTNSLIQASVSLTRMNKFLNADELDPNAVSTDASETSPIVIENGTFAWGHDEEDKPILNNIEMRVARGSLVGVVGTVGSGKSSLCSAMLGEMERRSGRVNVNGSIAYVPQQAWIQNAPLQNNILFGEDANEEFYQKVISACALEPDFAMLPAGDQTEIGEKGINLSGGQKQRVSLARAVYADADIFLLDDPLSAVDSHVGKHLFEQVIGPGGMLREKTRILVTHGLSYLKQMDSIVVLKNGVISEQGTYRELMAQKGEFREFLHQFLAEDQSEVLVEDLDEIKTEFEKSVGGKAVIGGQHNLIMTESSTGGKGPELNSNGSIRRRPVHELSESVSAKTIPGEAVKLIPAQATRGDKLIATEKTETGKVSSGVYLYYMRAIGGLASAGTIFFYASNQAFSVGSNIWLAKWSEDSDSATDDNVRNKYLGVYGALGIGQALTILFGAFICYYGSFKAAKSLHELLLANIMALPMSFFDTNPVGRILNRFGKDIDTLDNVLPVSTRAWLICATQVVSTFVVITYATPMFVVVMMPTMIIYYFVLLIFVASSRQLKRIESVSRSPIYSHFGESIQGSSTIRAFGKAQDFILSSEDKVDFNQISYYPSVIANRWLAIRLEFMGNVLTFFAAIFAVMGRGKNVSGGDVGLSITYAMSVTQILNCLIRNTSNVETNVVAVERVKEYTEVPTEADWEIPDSKPHESWPDKGVVSFNKYSIRYREGLNLVVRGIDCQIKPKEKVGIVGRTGAGKSSLTLGLFRIIEAAEGNITIDGVDISKIGLHDVRGRITILPQDPVLFSGNLRMNLDPFCKFTDDEVWNSLAQAHLKDFVKELPSKLLHEIAEGGSNLSLGQRQLVCLARALLRKTKVLILDEATAAVDLETDELVQATIRREFGDCTVLSIAHRLNTIMDADRILVLDKGEIVEFDSPSTLLADRHSIFYGMAKAANLVG